MKKGNSPTMKDVAREAGVALGTVSKVINNIPVGEEYKEKVNSTIAKLGYEVNTYARGLKASKTFTVTLIIPDITNCFNAAFAQFIESSLYEKGYKLVLCCSNGIREKEIEFLSLSAQNKSDGIIALTYSDVGEYVSEDIPLVAFDRHFNNSFTPRIASDNYKGGLMATEKLISLGCKHPAFIRFSSIFPGEADKRINGYLDACKKANISPIYLDGNDHDNVKVEIINFIKEHTAQDGSLEFDGLFANTDHNAYDACQIFHKLGHLVPEDIQIIGFDGITKFGYGTNEYYTSTICQPIKQLAHTCVDLVLTTERSMLPSLTLLPVTYQPGGTTRE